MSNLPGLDLVDHIIKAWSGALAAQTQVWNRAWNDMEAGTFEFKHWAAAVAKTYRHHFEACREVATFDVKSVEWQQKRIPREQLVPITFRVPARVPTRDVRITRMDRIGGPERGNVEVRNYEVTDGLLTVRVWATDATESGDQWIGFAYNHEHGGAPLGVVLLMIE